MSRESYKGPKVPKVLLDKVQNSTAPGQKAGVSRKDRRKVERQQKKTATRSRPVTILPRVATLPVPTSLPSSAQKVSRVAPTSKPLKSILKKSQPLKPEPELEFLSDSESAADAEEVRRSSSPVISQRAAKAGLAGNDAEIAALEKKLGIRGKTSKASLDDDLDFLLGGSDSEDGSDRISRKRKRPEDAKWLLDKRLKASGRKSSSKNDSQDSQESADESEMNEDEFSTTSDVSNDPDGSSGPDELSDSASQSSDLGVDNDTIPATKHVRENPYVAPPTGDAAPTTKYVPPSLRKAASSDEESLTQLRRQVQGQVNRLSEANVISIVQSIDQLLSGNPRQHVTSTLVDLILGLVSDPSPLSDNFLVLHAGFVAALYRVVGTDFGAQVVERLVQKLDRCRAITSPADKQSLNLTAFMACLYIFQVIGSRIVFDYIRVMMESISESNTELLLRTVRVCGSQLRQDDPSSLKDIVLMLQRKTLALDQDALSVRTKFMIETINDLKNNRLKTSRAASALTSEHVQNMKKLLGSLGTGSSKAPPPLGLSLADLQNTDKKGKWWLVGASYQDPAGMARSKSDGNSTLSKTDDLDAGYESETPGSINFAKAARAAGMNTDIRRAIFTAILSALDYKDAHMRLVKLHLKSKQEIEIPRVLLHCVGTEDAYNPFYALVALNICTSPKLKKALQYALWDALKRMGEGADTDHPDDDEESAIGSSELGTRKVVNLAKFYGTLVAERGLSIAILKTLEFAYLEPKMSAFAEVMLTTLLLQVYRKHTSDFEPSVKVIFSDVRGAISMVQGLQYFLQTVVSRCSLARKQSEKVAVKEGCKFAAVALADAAKAAPMDDADSEVDGSE